MNVHQVIFQFRLAYYLSSVFVLTFIPIHIPAGEFCISYCGSHIDHILDLISRYNHRDI
jgi:hypothetical protein